MFNTMIYIFQLTFRCNTTILEVPEDHEHEREVASLHERTATGDVVRPARAFMTIACKHRTDLLFERGP